MPAAEKRSQVCACEALAERHCQDILYTSIPRHRPAGRPGRSFLLDYLVSKLYTYSMATPKETCARQCRAEITRLSNKMRLLNREAMDWGTGEPLYTPEIHTIDAIGNGDGRTVTELAHWFFVTKGAVSQVVGRLARLGYITKHRNPRNGKEVLLSLTPKGQQVRASHEELHRQMDAALLDELQDVSSEQFDQFLNLLARVSGHMDRYLALGEAHRKGAAA